MTYLQRQNKTPLDLDEIGIRTRDFIVNSPSYEHELEEIPGMEGAIDLGSTMSVRTITCLFRFIADDWVDFGVKRDEVFDLFESGESFYLIEKRNKHKRWLVKVENFYDIPQRNVFGNFEIDFIAIKGRAESIGTTIQSETFKHLQDMPVTYTDYSDIYGTKFKVYNPGKRIDPRSINDFLKITYKGNSDNLRIHNLTTGDEWVYSGSSNLGDEIVLDGIRSEKNNLSIFRKTNKQIITLNRGWNYFEIKGAPDAREFAVQANLPRKKVDEKDKKNPITFEFVMKF